MHPIRPPDDIASLLHDFERMAGVVEYDFFAPDSDAGVEDRVADGAAHRRAVLLACERWNAEYREQAGRSLRHLRTNPALQGRNPPDKLVEYERQYTLHIEQGLQADPEKLTGQSITPYRFLGKSFKLGWLPRPRGEKAGVLRAELMDMGAELKRLGVSVQPDPSYELGSAHFNHAYAYAFSDPPYGLQEKDGAIRLQVFRGLNHAVFNDFAPDARFFAWSTDWCRHFEAGDEWWGSFLWTVYNPARNCIVVVSASTTD